jgi:plasmid stabilization system protein ParE
MNKLRLTVAARRDLESIQDKGLEDFGVSTVRAHMEGFDRVFALLRGHPSAGQARPEYGEGIRVFSHRPHRVLYRAGEREILIIRVLHSAMDVRKALRDKQ